MIDSLRQIFAFTRGEIVALGILLGACLIGGGVLLYEQSTESLPAQMIFEPIPTTQVAPLTSAPTVSESRSERPTTPDPARQTPVRPLIININTAPLDSLEMVPFIGATLARRIVAWRSQHGAFASVDDLVKVYGIGSKSIEKIRPYLICR